MQGDGNGDKKGKSLKRSARDADHEEALQTADMEDGTEPLFADGNYGLTEDMTRDLGVHMFGEGSEDENEVGEFEDEDMDDEDEDEDEEMTESNAGTRAVFRPGVDNLEEGETLEMDPSAYVMYHSTGCEWPCLSFDIIPDKLGPARSKFPLSATVVAGSQADKPNNNKLYVLKLSNLTKTQPKKVESDDESDDSDDEPELPNLQVARIPHYGGVNRVRTMPQEPHLVATWSEVGKVNIFDVRTQVNANEEAAAELDEKVRQGEHKGGSIRFTTAGAAQAGTPVYSYDGHKVEGWALDWSIPAPGRLATGDIHGGIRIWDVDNAAASAAMSLPPGSVADMKSVWKVESSDPFVSGSKNGSSVEDIQWSPTEATVFATASVDKSVRIWDTRARGKSMLTVEAHTQDVNVISWSRLINYLLVSGSDDGSFKIWDLRNFKADAPISHFKWHAGPITSVQWAPDDENVLCVASEDNTVTLWDMSLEEDAEAEIAFTGKKESTGLDNVPPQLLFHHAGQENMREAHFHPQLPGVVFSVAESGFNIWKPDVYYTT